ncbi:uncharacterized protein LOC118467456 isoform X2 [Anopheles albimanus]|uniref:uncharacterized protein LOC118467456 isoform X2 n=1 Tax=Anopheles albimanus TaxID=7167 RepID=UPI00164096C7|nr:uncharacterized protein LOC118467456 isoform X2 [Anopheles albimanus]
MAWSVSSQLSNGTNTGSLEQFSRSCSVSSGCSPCDKRRKETPPKVHINPSMVYRCCSLNSTRQPSRSFSSLSSLALVVVRLWIVLCCLSTSVRCFPKVFRTNEICGVYNGHRVYFELGDRGQLQATNVTVPYLPRASSVGNQTIANVCTLELVTCPSCNFKISLSYSNFPNKCSTVYNEPPCRCDYLEFTEPPFDAAEYTGRRNCGHDVVYQTQTRSVMIKFVYWSNHSHAFTLDYVAERNRETIQANPGPSPNVTDISGAHHHRLITTPHFPSYYPRDFGKEYVLSCNVEACRINVMFSDFQLAKTSTMDFYDWNGQRLCAVSGAIFRPPVVQSTGPSMIIRFYANGGSALGYRALVSFLSVASSTDRSLHPNTNCGGVVENIGGAITMMKMVNGANDSRIYDCVWLIKPPNTYAHLKTHLSLRVDTVEKLGPQSILTIIQGTTSDGTVLSMSRADGGGVSKKELVVPLTSGFYVHLRGTFGAMSRLALVYTAFSYMDCYIGSEFLCQNRKCIPIQLHCDGFDHCGDNSDEPESCVQQWAEDPMDRRWYAHTPNYYFPKMDRYPDLRTATIIFIGSSLGLIMLISALIVLLYRTGNRARQQRELHSQLQTISELLDSNATHGAEELDDPPNYEAPPDYDEIIKIGMDEEMGKGGKRRRHSSSASGRRSRMRRSRRPSNTSLDASNPILEVQLPPETDGGMPSTSGFSSGRCQVMDEASDYNNDSDACERFSEADLEGEDHDLRLASGWNRTERGDFFITSRILETAATPAGTGSSIGHGTATSASPPPTYAQSNAQYLATHTNSTVVTCAPSCIPSRGATAARIQTETTFPISLGVSFLPTSTLGFATAPSSSAAQPTPLTPTSSSAISSLNSQQSSINEQNVTHSEHSDNFIGGSVVCNTTSSILDTPAVVWSDTKRTSDRPWQAFSSSSDETSSAMPSMPSRIPVTTVASTTINSLDLTQLQEIDSYLLAYGRINATESGPSPGSSQETIGSNRTSLTQLTLSASTSVRSSCLCHYSNRSFHQLQSATSNTSSSSSATLSYEMLGKHCPLCRGHARSQPLVTTHQTQPVATLARTAAYCSICSGRIMLVPGTTVSQQHVRLAQQPDQSRTDQTLGPTPPVQVCTCFGRYPSQTNITRTTSSVGTLLATRTYSMDRLDDGDFAGTGYSSDRRSAVRCSGGAVSRFDGYSSTLQQHRSTPANERRRHEV